MLAESQPRTDQAWFKGPKDPSPFKFSSFVTANDQVHHCLACFPWNSQSLNTLWGGHSLHDPENRARWVEAVQRWMGAIAVGCTGCVIIYPKLATVRPIRVRLPEIDAEVQNIAWALMFKPHVRPLLVFTVNSVILIYDVTSHSIVGRLRGHGGPITSLAVHPVQPHLCSTTSRDFTTRLYDLSLEPVQSPNNPHWLPNKGPSFAGPAHGLHMCEPEGEGTGRCVCVMVGGRSGGHRGAVFTSAFHPSAPLLATGGMDRAVKIWRIPPSVFSPSPDVDTAPILEREDKPLFSTDLIHKARVSQAEWLADDVLVSCSAPALMRHDENDREKVYEEEGTVVLWQWLGFNRFFPPGKLPQKIMRGTASDWRNSESYKILSAYHMPQTTTRVHVYRSLKQDPMVLIPMKKTIRTFSIGDFKARNPPKFPLDDIVSLTVKMRLDDDEARPAAGGGGGAAQHADVNAGLSGGAVTHNDANSSQREDQETTTPSSNIYPQPAPLDQLFLSVEGWEVAAESLRRDAPEIPEITACAMGFDGRGIVGIGGTGSLYVWRLAGN
ncbi:WD40 repeat-like protein [Daedaleopsis nitida]|nr:WD40 repeat-like protein [Daedaleopsis nitida]